MRQEQTGSRSISIPLYIRHTQMGMTEFTFDEPVSHSTWPIRAMSSEPPGIGDCSNVPAAYVIVVGDPSCVPTIGTWECDN